MSKWNYRVFRGAEPDGSPFYEIRETHYEADGSVKAWSEDGIAVMGETFHSLINDLAWQLAALTKPILDGETGRECEPARMVEDDLKQWMDARADVQGEA